MSIQKKFSKSTILTIIQFSGLVLLQIILWPNFGTLDMHSFIAVIQDQQLFGLIGGYHYYNLYYPPLASVFLYPVTIVGINLQQAPVWSQALLIKMVLAMFYYWFIWLIFRIYKNNASTIEALAKINSILMNVALFESAIILSYLDILIAPFMLLSFYWLVKKTYFASGLALACAFMTKLLPVLLVPAFILYFCTKLPQQRLTIDWRSITLFLAGLGCIVVPLLWLFGYDEVKNIVQVSNGHGTYLSLSYNFNKIVSVYLATNDTPVIVGYLNKLMFMGSSAIFLLKLLYSKKNIITLTYAGLGIMLSYFVWSNGVHENHLFPAFILGMILFIYQPSTFHKIIYYNLTVLTFLELFIPYGLGIHFGAYLNLAYFLSLSSLQMQIIQVAISCLIILFFLYYLQAIIRLPKIDKMELKNQ